MKTQLRANLLLSLHSREILFEFARRRRRHRHRHLAGKNIRRTSDKSPTVNYSGTLKNLKVIKVTKFSGGKKLTIRSNELIQFSSIEKFLCCYQYQWKHRPFWSVQSYPLRSAAMCQNRTLFLTDLSANSW